MTYVPDPIIEQYIIDPGTEADTWGDLLNINRTRLAQAAQGVLTKNVTGITSWTLDDTDFTGTESHYKAIFLLGTMNANLEIFFPIGKQRAMRLFNNTISSSVGTPRTVTLKIAGGGGIAPFNEVTPIVHGDRLAFLLREDGTFWPEFQASKILPKSDGELTGPLNANNQPITNIPHPTTTANYNAAPVQWVSEFVESRIASLLADERNRLYPVGCAYFSLTNPANPATYLLFGTWAPWGNGTALFCAGVQPDSNGEVINLSGAADRPGLGTYWSRLVQANLPPASITTGNPSDDSGGFDRLEASSAGSLGNTTIQLGSSAPFLNLPPLSVAFVWRRVA